MTKNTCSLDNKKTSSVSGAKCLKVKKTDTKVELSAKLCLRSFMLKDKPITQNMTLQTKFCETQAFPLSPRV